MLSFILTILGYLFVVGGPVMLVWIADATDAPFALLMVGDFAWLAGAVAFLTWRFRQRRVD